MIKFLIFTCVALNLFTYSHGNTLFLHPKERPAKRPSRAFRIINGDEASPHQFPYQVGIYIPLKSYTDFCGGSLISSKFVLTAAHCLDKATTEVTLVFGAHNISATEDSQIRQKSKDFIIHEGWDGETINKDDIALIKLSSPISENNVIKIIKLAKGSNKFDKKTGVVAGWGITRMDQTTVTPVLRYITPSIISNDDCKKVDSDYESVVVDTVLCISGEGKKGTCKGDSGGPLAVDGVQVGIVSFGANDCAAGKPSIFTRVTEFQDWIAKNSDVNF